MQSLGEGWGAGQEASRTVASYPKIDLLSSDELLRWERGINKIGNLHQNKGEKKGKRVINEVA